MSGLQKSLGNRHSEIITIPDSHTAHLPRKPEEIGLLMQSSCQSFHNFLRANKSYRFQRRLSIVVNRFIRYLKVMILRRRSYHGRSCVSLITRHETRQNTPYHLCSSDIYRKTTTDYCKIVISICGRRSRACGRLRGRALHGTGGRRWR